MDTCRLLRADGSEHSLDSPAVDAVEAFARALDGLVSVAQGVVTNHPPLFDLGVEITRVLAEAEASLRR